jgi:hypothetical protein
LNKVAGSMGNRRALTRRWLPGQHAGLDPHRSTAGELQIMGVPDRG